MKISSLFKSAAVFAAALATVPAAASTVVVNATSQSWCASAYFGCVYYTPSPHVLSPFTGNSGGNQVRGYLLFDIPVGNYTAATLSIFNDGRNYTEAPGNTFTLRAAPAINYTALGTGPVLASANVGAIDTGISHFEAFGLNGTAVGLLNGAAGGSFLFGGAASGDLSVESELFGYVNGPAAYLTLTLADSAVPEPATWAMLIVGFGAIGGAIRMRPRAKYA